MSEILKPSEDLLIPMAREVIEHARSGTMKQAPEIMKLPAAHYTDSLRFNGLILGTSMQFLFLLMGASIFDFSIYS